MGIDYGGKKIGMWLFLFTELLFFGGMFLLYSVFRYRFPLDFHAAAREESLLLGSLNTVLLLTSSLTIALSLAFLRRGQVRLAVAGQAATLALGLAFLIIKGLEWNAKIQAGLYPDGPVLLAKNKGEILFFGLYYVMTGIHGLHVLIGLAVITFLLFFTVRGTVSPRDPVKLENTGLYWHFVDIVWIYLFPLFYLVT